MSNFDVIGRHNFVSQSLCLPRVLTSIVVQYIGNEVVPLYSIPCESYYVIGVVGTRVFTNPYLYHVKKLSESLVLVAGHLSFEIRHIKTDEVVFQSDCTHAVVHKQMVYFIDHDYRLMRYKPSSNVITCLDTDVFELRKCYETIIIFYIATYRLLNETRLGHALDLLCVMVYKKRRYHVYQTSVTCQRRRKITFPHTVKHAVGVDGFIVLQCHDDKQYVLDLKRWKLIPIENLCIRHHFIHNCKEHLLEVYS